MDLQHPVPQQISSYQFRLVGDMTLKQFFQLAAGALLAMLVYASPIPGVFKWPLIIFFVISGAAFAFLPIEERPLEVWVLAFFRSIYSPTLFYWKKTQANTKFFVDDQSSQVLSTPLPNTQVSSPTPEANKNNFLTRLEDGEKNFFSKVTGMFNVLPPTQAKPQILTQVVETATSPQIETPTQPVAKPIVLPPNQPITVQKTAPSVQTSVELPTNVQTSPVSQTLPSQQTGSSTQAQFSVEAAPPHPPTQANIIVGQVMDSQSKIVEGAILEVRDPQGRPVRALRSNKAGHFLIVTPLSDGKYDLIVEKEGFNFEPILFEAKGEIIPPMAIRAK